MFPLKKTRMNKKGWFLFSNYVIITSLRQCKIAYKGNHSANSKKYQIMEIYRAHGFTICNYFVLPKVNSRR